MLKIVIADDEFPSRQELRALLETNSNLEIIAECEHGEAVLDYFSNNTADAVFLDIEMPVLDGLAVGEKLKTLPNPPKIIFSTGFDQFAVRAFELEAFDYILKPYTKTRLQATVIKLQKVLQNQSQQQLPSRCNFPIKLSIWNNNKLLVFNPKEEIYLIKTDTSKKILIYTNKGILESNLPLKTLEEKLCPCGFLRTHKSYIVNMNKVREIIPWFNDTLQAEDGIRDWSVTGVQPCALPILFKVLKLSSIYSHLGSQLHSLNVSLNLQLFNFLYSY